MSSEKMTAEELNAWFSDPEATFNAWFTKTRDEIIEARKTPGYEPRRYEAPDRPQVSAAPPIPRPGVAASVGAAINILQWTEPVVIAGEPDLLPESWISTLRDIRDLPSTHGRPND